MHHMEDFQLFCHNVHQLFQKNQVENQLTYLFSLIKEKKFQINSVSVSLTDTAGLSLYFPFKMEIAVWSISSASI